MERQLGIGRLLRCFRQLERPKQRPGQGVTPARHALSLGFVDGHFGAFLRVAIRFSPATLLVRKQTREPSEDCRDRRIEGIRQSFSENSPLGVCTAVFPDRLQASFSSQSGILAESARHSCAGTRQPIANQWDVHSRENDERMSCGPALIRVRHAQADLRKRPRRNRDLRSP